ncbi:MAG: TetR family transcriptional regulator C-terminal domain-containing protein [Dongiaceae bacterium]
MAGRAAPAAAGGTDRRIRARNKQRILEAALGIFAERGFDGASIAGIAQRAGLPKANVYYYFAGKEAIYAALIDGLIAEWDRALDELRPEREPADALAAYIRAKLDFSRRHAAQSRLFANEVVHGGRFLSRASRAHMQAITVEKAAVLEGWARAGKMDPVDPSHLFILLWGATQFYADFEVMARTALDARRLGGAEFEAAAAAIVRVVLKGCGIAA